MAKVTFDSKNTLVRHVVIQRLRHDNSWSQLDLSGGVSAYVDMQNEADLWTVSSSGTAAAGGGFHQPSQL